LFGLGFGTRRQGASAAHAGEPLYPSAHRASRKSPGGRAAARFPQGEKVIHNFHTRKCTSKNDQKLKIADKFRQVPTKNSKKAPDSALPTLTFRPTNCPSAPKNAGCPLKRGCFRPFRAPPEVIHKRPARRPSYSASGPSGGVSLFSADGSASASFALPRSRARAFRASSAAWVPG